MHLRLACLWSPNKGLFGCPLTVVPAAGSCSRPRNERGISQPVGMHTYAVCFAEPTLVIKVGPLVLEFDVLDVYEISLSLVRGTALAAIGKKTTPAWALSMWQTSNLFGSIVFLYHN